MATPIYNPDKVAISNPLTATELFANKMVQNSNANHTLDGSAVLLPRINSSPLGYEDIATINGKYNFDLSSTLLTRHVAEFPIMFAADFNAKKTSTGGDVHVWGEDADQDAHVHDSKLSSLRIASAGSNGSPYAINHASRKGGQLIWRTMTAAQTDINLLTAANVRANTAGVTTLTNGAVVTQTADAEATILTGAGGLLNHKILPLAWRVGTGEEANIVGGSAQGFVAKMAALLEGNWYRKIGVAEEIKEATSSTAWFGYVHESVNSKPVCTVHAMFPDIMINIDGTDMQLNEVNVRIDSFYFRADYSQFIILLDFNYCNVEEPLGTTNVVLLEEVRSSSATTCESGFTRLSDHILLGMYLGVPGAIAQGSDITEDLHSGYLYDAEYKQNFTQIIQSPQIKITGTYLASNNFKVNTPQKLRDDLLYKFKIARRNTMLFGSGDRKKNATGQTIQSTSGLFDYEKFPIRYMRGTLNRYSASNYIDAVNDFIEKFARSVFAYKNSSSSSMMNVYCSKFFMTKLDKAIKLGFQQNNNLLGYSTTGGSPLPSGNVLNLDLQFTDVKTAYGTLRFTVDPGLDMMTEMMLPAFMGTTINPKNMLLAIDKSKISTVSLRAATLRGNIQNNSADYTMEDILSEETFELLDPFSHAIMMVDIV